MDGLFNSETLLQRLKRLNRRSIVRPYGLSFNNDNIIKSSCSTDNYQNQQIVIEIEGDNSNEICLHLCIDPIIHKQIELYNSDDGNDYGGVSVVFFDLERRIKPNQIFKMIESRVRNIIQNDETKIKRIINSISSRFLIYHIRSALHLLITLHSLENTLFCDLNVDIDSIIIDSLGSLHFLTAPTEPLAGGLTTSIPKMLKKLQTSYQFTIFATKPLIFSQKSINNINNGNNDYLSKSWKDMVTHRVSIAETSNNSNTFDACVINLSNSQDISYFSYMIVSDRGAIII